MIPTIKTIKNLKGKRIILRLDFNVPMNNGKIRETMRIDRALPTIEYLIQKKARIIILSHMGKDESSSLKPIVNYLNKKIKVGFVPDFRKEETRKVVDGLPEGGVVLFENLRLDGRETANDSVFAKYLASFGDIYINDAFAVSHRAHASTVGITKYLPSYIGFLIADELKNLSLALNPKHPFLFILGGAKFETKMPLLKKFMKQADHVFIGGVLANDFFRDAGLTIGKSFVDNYDFKLTPLLQKGNIILPKDVIVTNPTNKKGIIKNIDTLTDEDSIVDAGPGTIKSLAPLLKKVKLILWNGPLGYYEGGFEKGTIDLLKSIAKTKATSIIGGGDTAVIVEKLKLKNKISFISTGGGATLDYLANGKLIGIEAVKKCTKRK